MEDSEYRREDEIRDTSMGRPHVVILGAGASRAAFPEGDKNGKHLPLMNDFVEVLDLKNVLDKYQMPEHDNFEEVYSKIYSDPKYSSALNEIEGMIRDYFSTLELPHFPTIYDYLVLSLRKKDVIATFNWDPFLFDALNRNSRISEMPRALFLHGSVNVGFCEGHRRKGHIKEMCSECGKEYTPTHLLYPILEKNYTEDHFIHSEWTTLQDYLKDAFVLTLFGYGAPKSDVKAIELLKEGWGLASDRSLEEIEIINTSSEEELLRTWKDFIHTHHYRTTSNFFDSLIGNHPRRSCEAMRAELIDAKYIDNNPTPRDVGLTELREWYSQITEFEKNGT